MTNVTIVEDQEKETIECVLSSIKTEAQKAILNKLTKIAKEGPYKIADDVSKNLLKDMEKNAKNVLLKMMGFEVGWDHVWKIDHCNGRAGESAIGDVVRKNFTGAAQDFVNRHQSEIFQLTEKEHNQIILDMRLKFREYIRYQSIKEVKKFAQNYIDEQVRNLKEEFDSYDIFGTTERRIDSSRNKDK